MVQWFDYFRDPLDSSVDPTIQKTVYNSFYKFVYPSIYPMILDHLLTEDIIQDSFIKSITKGPYIRTDSNIQAWIKRLAYNTTLDYLRKLNRERRLLAHPCSNNFETPSDSMTVDREVERKETNEELYRAIDELKLDYQVALILFYVEGKTYREICNELRLTESVFTQRLARARKKLLHNLQRLDC